MLNKQYLYLLITISSLLIFNACSTDVDPDTDSATINGSVESVSTQQKAKSNDQRVYTISAARVTSNGSLETIENTSTNADASGNFTLNVDVDVEDIVIEAEEAGNEWRGFLSNKLENGNTYTLKPLNGESTAETDVFMSLAASNDVDIVQKADIETVISGEVAAGFQSSASAASRFATGLKNAAQARVEYFQEVAEDNSESMLEATYNALLETQIQLEADLSASVNAEQQSDAYNTFLENTFSAYSEAGLSASNSGKAIEMWGRVFTNSLTNVSTETVESARAQTYLLIAVAIDNAVRAEAEASSMSDSSQQAVAEAGAELKAAVRASAGVRSEIDSAFENYHEEVRNTMASDASFSAEVVVQIDSEINSTAGAKAALDSVISGILNIETLVNAYLTFYSEVGSVVEENLTTASEADIEAVTELMILINLVS